MPLILFIIFVAVPLAEIAVFIYVGDLIGIAATIALVIITAMIGTVLLRMQGLSVLQNAQRAFSEGRVPVDSVIDGMCLLIAGAFLLTPGLITDSIGFLLFIPAFRHNLAHWFFRRIMAAGKVKVSVFGEEPPTNKGGQKTPESSGPIIEGDFTHIDPENPEEPRSKPGQSPWQKKE